tara:strand:- start:5553 stop:5672 length:120 start_codon:yes stop_codon:yes gene_type:complete
MKMVQIILTFRAWSVFSPFGFSMLAKIKKAKMHGWIFFK